MVIAYFNIIGFSITIFANSIFIASIGLFINNTTRFVANQIIPCIIFDTVHEDQRGKHIIIVYTLFAVGVALNGLVFLLASNWKIAIFIYQIIPNALALFGIIFYVR
jgi:hypothetical protein